MKYVRTKDGKIYQFVKIEEHGRSLEGYANQEEINAYLGGTFLGKDNILKQANTIEELCDNFVVAYEDGSKMVYNDLEWAKYQANRCLTIGNIKSIIYGSIWIDNNLIKVTKMNEQGELELL